MIFIKGCKRCGGTLVPDEDRFGNFYNCLACGAILERKGLLEFVGPRLAPAAVRVGPDGRQQRRPSHRGSGL